MAGNVYSDSTTGPQQVNALDIGLTGIRAKFGFDVSDPANAPYDVDQDGAINALNWSRVRLNHFANTAP